MMKIAYPLCNRLIKLYNRMRKLSSWRLHYLHNRLRWKARQQGIEAVRQRGESKDGKGEENPKAFLVAFVPCCLDAFSQYILLSANSFISSFIDCK